LSVPAPGPATPKRVIDRLTISLEEARETPPRGVLPSLIEGYRRDVRQLFADHPYEKAIRLAVGGSWDAAAALEVGALRLAGVRDDHDLVDVGCGAGRLAERLRGTHRGRYLGTDVIPELLEHARRLAPEWEFRLVESCAIPWPDRSADAVCFFSVVTHLPHEASFAYLRESTRVLRPGGRVVLSFLELAEPDHWTVFGPMAESLQTRGIHNQFVHREDLTRMAGAAGLRVQRIIGGSEAVVPIDGTYVMDDGRVLKPPSPFIQSLAVLRKAHGTSRARARSLWRRRRWTDGNQGVH
jgi:SAM-dependent methyltransferase